MTAVTLPNVGIQAGFTEGESGWSAAMNRNLRAVDALVQPRVVDKDLTAPPSASAGDVYIVAASATGDWAGQDGKLAIWCVGDDLASEWVFVTPKSGWFVWVVDESKVYRYTGSAWVIYTASASVAAADITDGTPVGRAVMTAADALAARTAIGAGTSNFSGVYSDLTGKPTLGTASALNVAASGNAAAGEVVKGDDTRLGTGGMTNPMTTAGDMIIGGASGAPTRLAAGTNTIDVLGMASGAPAWVKRAPLIIPIACSDESTALAAGVAKVTFRMPCAMTLVAVRASLTTAQASGSIFTVDINEGGTTILSTKLTIDNTEKTSTTAATPAVISDTALADDAEMTIDIDQVGDGTAAGLKVYLIGWPA